MVFGDGAIGELALELKKLGVERAVIVTDKILREKTDVVKRVEPGAGGGLPAALFGDGVGDDHRPVCSGADAPPADPGWRPGPSGPVGVRAPG